MNSSFGQVFTVMPSRKILAPFFAALLVTFAAATPTRAGDEEPTRKAPVRIPDKTVPTAKKAKSESSKKRVPVKSRKLCDLRDGYLKLAGGGCARVNDRLQKKNR